MMTPELSATCIHEASHAIQALLERAGLELVEVNGEFGSTSHRLIRLPDLLRESESPDGRVSPVLRRKLERFVRIALAGPIGEQRAFGGPGAVAGDVDYERARAAVYRFQGTDADLKALAAEVERSLARPQVWRAVEAVAVELSLHKTLTGARVREIMRALQGTAGLRYGWT